MIFLPISKKSRKVLSGFLLTNLFPILGVLFLRWRMEMVLLNYFAESLAISFFGGFRVGISDNYTETDFKGLFYSAVDGILYVMYGVLITGVLFTGWIALEKVELNYDRPTLIYYGMSFVVLFSIYCIRFIVYVYKKLYLEDDREYAINDLVLRSFVLYSFVVVGGLISEFYKPGAFLLILFCAFKFGFESYFLLKWPKTILGGI